MEDGEEVVFEVIDVDEKIVEDMMNGDVKEEMRVIENVENVKDVLEFSYVGSLDDIYVRLIVGLLESFYLFIFSLKNNKLFDCF